MFVLAAARVVLEPAAADDAHHLAALEERLGRSIAFTARGPHARQVEVRGEAVEWWS